MTTDTMPTVYIARLIALLPCIPDTCILSYVTGLVEECYHHNPYHNAIHAADVTQAMHCYIMQEKVTTIARMYIVYI